MARLTDLEDSLMLDIEGVVHRKLLDQIGAAKRHLQKQHAVPSAPAAYRATFLQIEACTVAEKIISILWNRYHSSKIV